MTVPVKRRFGGIALLALAVVLLWTPATARASGNVLAVSTPAAPLAVRAGDTTESWLRIANNGDTPLTVSVRLGALRFADDGGVSILDSPDPTWRDRIAVEQAALTLAPRSFVQDPVRISAPTSLVPDTYFIGFLVTPRVAGNGVRVVNQIGAFLAFDVPGPRNRSVRIEHLSAPGFVFGSTIPVAFRLRNTGSSFATGWSEAHVAPFFRTEMLQALPGRVRIPANHYRTVAFSTHVRFGLGPAHIRVFGYYNRSDQQVGQTVAEATVWILHPLYVILAALGFSSVVLFRVWRRRPTVPRSARPRDVDQRELVGGIRI